ncbi:RHS repeat domain-containing protein [Flavobacterium sp. FlaQc-30]|uniref:RHS repeat domain-containing protein n=1 Tax=Flavobacterium sp. FlaQc-30 TaxID=3374179 RepID=UPI003756633D
MKKTLLAIIITIIVISCASEETPTPTVPEGNVPTEPITPTVPPVVKVVLKPAITNNILKSLTAKNTAESDSLKLVKKVYYYRDVLHFAQEAAIKDSLNKFRDTIKRWWGSRTDFEYDARKQLKSTKKYAAGYNGNQASSNIDFMDTFSYSNGKVSTTTENRYLYDTRGNITELKTNDDITVQYTYDDQDRLTQAKKYVAYNNSFFPNISGHRYIIDFVYMDMGDNKVKVSAYYWMQTYDKSGHIVPGQEHYSLNEDVYNIDTSKPGIYANEAWYKVTGYPILFYMQTQGSDYVTFSPTPTTHITDWLWYANRPIKEHYIYNKQGYLIKKITTTEYTNGIASSITLFEY